MLKVKSVKDIITNRTKSVGEVVDNRDGSIY